MIDVATFVRRNPSLLMALALGAGYDFHQFGNLSPLFGAIARDDRILDTMSDMIAQDFFLRASKRRTHRGDLRNGDLRNDVDAIPIFFDHPSETANLAFDPIESFKT